MIKNIGIGIDIVDITRFQKMPFNENEKFYEKIFLPSEIKYCLKFKKSYERFAGKFAIKEAVQKSIPEKISLNKIETFHKKSKPQVQINLNKEKYSFLVSLTHDKELAIAVVLSEKIS